MRKLLTALAVTAFGFALATVGSLAINETASAAKADPCIQYRDFGYMSEQNRARAEVKLDAGCGERKLVMKTWYAKSLDDGSQDFHDSQWLMYKGETVKLTPQDPWTPIKVQYGDKACFHQIDIVDVTNGDNDGDNKIVAALIGGTKDCRPLPVYSCDALGVTNDAKTRRVTVNNFKVTATNASLNYVMLTWGDGSSLRVEGSALNATHQYAQDGTYAIQAVAYFSYKNKVGNPVTKAAKVTDACKATVTYTTAPGMQQVCNVTTGKVETIPEGPYDTTKYAPVDDERCKGKTLTVTSTTTPPAELTKTGPGAAAALFGAATAVGAAGHYVLNRRRG